MAADLDGLQYAFDCGTGYGAWGTVATATCAAADSGPLTVRGRVKDKDLGESAYAAMVAVTNVAPPAVLSSGAPASEGEAAARGA